MQAPFFQHFIRHLRSKKVLFATLLFLATIYQIWILSPQVSQDLIRIRKDIGQSGLWRSANFSQNQRFANYVKYLHENVPPNARVILPSRDTGLQAAATTPYMQFFLAPREVLNCIQPINECIQMLSNDRSYFVILDAPTIQDYQSVLSQERLILFDQLWGVYLPEMPSLVSSSPLPTFQKWIEIFIAFIGPALWLVMIVASGLLFTHKVLLSSHWLMRMSLAFGLGMGLISLSTFLLMLAGIPITSLLVLFITVIWITISFIYWLFTHKSGINTEQRNWKASIIFKSMDPWPVAYIILGIVTTILSIGKGYHTTDAIALWGAKGYGIASQGLFSGASDWGTSTTRYPLHIPILIAAFKVLFGEILPASKLLFPLYYFALLGTIYAYLETKIPRSIAGFSTLSFAFVPLLFRHAQIAYANLPFTFYYVSFLLIALDALRNAPEDYRPNRSLLAGILLMLSAWTRPEGIPISLLTLVLISFLTHIHPKIIYSKSLLPLAAPILIFIPLWLLISRTIYPHVGQNSNLLSKALHHILRGDFHLSEFVFVLNYSGSELLTPGTWGIVGISLLLFVPAGFLISGNKSLSYIVLFGLLFIVIFLGIYYLTSFEDTHDISWWVSTGLNRMILPGVALVWIGFFESIFDN